MKGLILKDLFLIKGNIKIITIILICFCFIAFKDAIFISFIIPFISVIMCITTFSYDDYNKWDAYAITVPNGRNNVVKSKYITTLILIAITSILSIILFFIILSIQGNINIENFIYQLLGGICGILLFVSLVYPLIYKLGTEKARIYVFLLIAFLSGGISIIVRYLPKFNDFFNIIDKYGIFILSLLVLIVLYISYLISIKIYSKKEF